MHYFVESLQTRYELNSLCNHFAKKRSVLNARFTWILKIVVICFLWLKDITTRVIAHELNLEDTPVSKVMTRNPVFVLSDTLAVEALQKMVQG